MATQIKPEASFAPTSGDRGAVGARIIAILFTGLLIGTLVMAPLEASAASNPIAERLADKMLLRLGGRDNWASLRNTVNGSRQNRALNPTEVYSVITMDFELPRFRIDTIGEDLRLVRVIDGGQSWRISWSGVVENLPAEGFEDDMAWYQAHIYRTIHRIAVRDSALHLGVVKPNQLEVFEGDTRLLWNLTSS